MSTATPNGGESVKSPAPTGGKQQLRNNSTSRPLDGARKQNGSPVDGQAKKPQAPKAWQGPNPITSQRPSSVTNGTDKPLPKVPQEAPQNQLKSLGDGHPDRHAHDRALFLFANFVGKDAVITLKNGEQFSGVFSGGAFAAAKCQYVLKMAKRTKAAAPQQTNGAIESPTEYVGQGEDHALTIDANDTLDLSVKDVTVSSTGAQQNGSVGSTFMTDTQISGRDPQTPRERELKRWEPGPETSVDLSLDSSGGAGWDQFAVNERKYGVQTTYDESMYTTVIDRNNPQYKQRQAEAERIAREIEGSAPMNAHVAEERRRDASREDGGDEEEDKYSGVRREGPSLPKRAAGSYIPPSQRPITGTPTVPGAPFDPAIISTQLAKPAAQPSKISDEKPSAPVLPTAAPASAASAIPALAAVEQQKQQSAAAQRSQQIAALAATATSKKGSENTTEIHVRDTADAFKQFVSNEKLKLKAVRAQGEAAKKAHVKREQNVKINDLKKFAANFRLTSRVPDDLVPILAKDREKQIEIQNKAEAVAKEEEQREKHRLSTSQLPSPQQRPSLQTKPHPSIPVTPSLPAQVNLPPSAPLARQRSQLPGETTPRLNLNAKAFEFRPSGATLSAKSPSPHHARPGSGKFATAPVPFFDQGSPKPPTISISAFNPLKKLSEVEFRNTFASNGNFPQAYHTLPTWGTKEGTSTKIEQMFPASLPNPPEPSPLHPQFHGSPMVHMHPGVPSPYSNTPAAMHPRPYFGHQQQPPPHFQPHFVPHMPQHQQHVPQFRGSPNPQFRQMLPPQQQGYGGMPPPPFHGQPPPPMQPQFQPPPPFQGPGPNMMGGPAGPYRSPNMSYRMPGNMPPQFPPMGGQGYR